MPAPAHPETRNEPSPLADLAARAERERLRRSALKAFFTIVDRWRVKDEEARQLLGGASNGPYADLAFTSRRDPYSYVASQGPAESLIDARSLGVVHPSLRWAGGTCLACFRPALVMNVRKGVTYRFRWDGRPTPTILVST